MCIRDRYIVMWLLADIISNGNVALAGILNAVSYTHLDVYKRQPITSEYLDYDEVLAKYKKMLDWLAGLYVNILNLIPVSYTHLIFALLLPIPNIMEFLPPPACFII